MTLPHITTPTQRPSPLSVKLDSKEKDLLMQMAKEKQRSVHFLMCQAVREYIEREQAHKHFFEEGRKAIEHYNQTGLHVTHDEIKSWAESLGTPKELPHPVCHK
ncbi:conserved hypothetical protein [Crenothrix polyspora]|uniref:Ribbon-helix-helix protein CopG domain-containing protein n=1 Tax=Crenothrix polyspora TaxID=360316 RepID=A0A1R4H9G3_9GAMM|nr:ribbon-helix-helix protein, CopG family [Crenothrix polyspora]SJM92875.1 conserved hypothetical protein [Crenothrix polyspora]